MGMATALKLVGNDYSNASSAFFIAATVSVIPNSKYLAISPLRVSG
jgi:hypothetical protein